jgi:hypothetical protein
VADHAEVVERGREIRRRVESAQVAARGALEVARLAQPVAGVLERRGGVGFWSQRKVGPQAQATSERRTPEVTGLTRWAM